MTVQGVICKLSPWSLNPLHMYGNGQINLASGSEEYASERYLNSTAAPRYSTYPLSKSHRNRSVSRSGRWTCGMDLSGSLTRLHSWITNNGRNSGIPYEVTDERGQLKLHVYMAMFHFRKRTKPSLLTSILFLPDLHQTKANFDPQLPATGGNKSHWKFNLKDRDSFQVLPVQTTFFENHTLPVLVGF